MCLLNEMVIGSFSRAKGTDGIALNIFKQIPLCCGALFDTYPKTWKL